ncbi:hypothetical protein ABZ379_29370 [Streptomyces canus]|uniref:hypothetical protein n=1 Tax=Streptomyces canus TaxID=58343 RepID=UPI0033F551E4
MTSPPTHHRADRFEVAVTQARTGLAGTEYRAYEAGLVSLGTFAGTSDSYGSEDDSEPAAPDAVWIFDDARWITWEAKSEASTTGEVGPDNVRQAQAHLNYTETERQESAPSGWSASIPVFWGYVDEGEMFEAP